MRKTPQEKVLGVVRVLVLVFFLLMVILPIYWMVVTSFKTNAEIIDAQNLTYYPHTFTLENYVGVFTLLDYGSFMKNSIILSLICAIVVTIISIFGGYGLARFKFKGKGAIVLFILVTQMIPSILILIPMYSIFAKMGVIAKLPQFAMLVYYIIANIPFCSITMRSFFENIPYSLEEAAMVDGCSRMQCIAKIVIPVMLPGIVAVFCFAFIGAWNDLMAGVIFASQPSQWTIPVGLKSLLGKNGVQWGMLMAGGVLALLPTAVMFMIMQRYIVDGLTAGAVKE